MTPGGFARVRKRLFDEDMDSGFRTQFSVGQMALRRVAITGHRASARSSPQRTHSARSTPPGHGGDRRIGIGDAGQDASRVRSNHVDMTPADQPATRNPDPQLLHPISSPSLAHANTVRGCYAVSDLIRGRRLDRQAPAITTQRMGREPCISGFSRATSIINDTQRKPNVKSAVVAAAAPRSRRRMRRNGERLSP
jgi:hypothetical protein